MTRPAGAQRIRDARLARGWTLAELARRIGVSVETVRRWEEGRSVRGKNLVRLTEELDLSAEELTEGHAHVYAVREDTSLTAQLKTLRDDVRGLHRRFDRIEQLLKKRL